MVLAVPPRHTAQFVGEAPDSVAGQAGFPIARTATFQNCSELDVLVVGDLAEQFTDNPEYRRFIEKRSAAARFVIGISRGAVALARAGLLQGRQATADGALRGELAAHGVVLKEGDGLARDGQYFTCGPSTGAYEAAFAVLRKLAGDVFSGIWELTVECNPSRRFATGKAAAPASSAALDGLAPLKVAVVIAPGMFGADVMGAVDVLQALPRTEFFYV